MHTHNRVRLVALVGLLTIVLYGCADGPTNSNQQNANVATATGSQKNAHWVAQFRSPSSANVQGTNLGFFSYSAISVVSQNTVFVAGDMPFFKNSTGRIGVIVRTTDGGKNWDEKLIQQPGIEIQSLNSIHFVDAQNGWAVGLDSNDNGVMLKTTDGGQNWAISKVSFKQHPTVVYFADTQTGWMGGSTLMPGQEEESEGGPSDILYTTDGGTTWTAQRRVPVSILDFSFVDKMQGWASGFRGVIYHTTDGGRNWSQQRSELEMGTGIVNPESEGGKKFMITAIQFLDPHNGWAAAAAEEGNLGRALGTNNGGDTWTRRWIVADSGVRDLFFISPNIGWAGTTRGRYIYYTSDGARSWLSEPVQFEQDVPIHKIAGADASHVWAAGGGAIFFRVTE